MHCCTVITHKSQKMSRILLALVVLACVRAVPFERQADSDSAVDKTEEVFHIKPSVDQLHEVKLDGKTCQVSFRAAYAAHGEEWHMKIVKQGGFYVCTVKDADLEPPHATFFGFSAHMFGAKGERLSSYEVWDHQGALLEGDEYIEEGVTVRSAPHWRLNGLSKIVMKCE